MDTIDRINQYRDLCRHKYAPVVVKKQRSANTSVLYVAIRAKKEECATIKADRELLPFVAEDLINHNIITDISQVDAVLLCGDLSKFKKYAKLVYKFPLRKIDVRNRVEEQFRLYTKTAEQQKNLMLNFNLCPTAELSWKSVLEKIGTNYGLLLKIKIIDTSDKDKLDELVKKFNNK